LQENLKFENNRNLEKEPAKKFLKNFIAAFEKRIETNANQKVLETAVPQALD
jgi:hypothetical protein